MEAFSTTLNNEETNWEKLRTKSAVLRLTGEIEPRQSFRLVGENQPSRHWLGKWVVALLCAISSSILVYSIFLRA